MKTIRVIDLLNMISKDEDVPKRIKYCGVNYKYDVYDYFNEDEDDEPLSSWIDFSKKDLNDELEIIEDNEIEIIGDIPKEDKKIEKIEERIDTGLVGKEILDEFKVAGAINKQAGYTFDIAKKINEIIDMLNGEDNDSI